MAVATTLLCGATLGGSAVFTGDSGTFSPSSSMSSARQFPTYQGAKVATATTTTSTTTTAVPMVASSLFGESQSGTSSPSGGTAGSLSGNTAVTPFSSSQGKSGGTSSGSPVGGSSAGSASGATTSTGVGVSSVADFPVMALASVGASAPQRVPSSPRRELLGGEQGALSVYDGNQPGVIYGLENQNLDNAIITCYGLPIGDSLWPLLLMAMAYGLYIIVGKLNRQR